MCGSWRTRSATKLLKESQKMRLTKRFGDKALKEAQDILNRVMAEVDGFKDVHFTNNIPIIALAD